ncbi:MAG TPA: adenylyl-sulfate kinase [Acidimicrobiales bacterium]|nr:adenylyl-sulfate kinase [Acidimicrobiales bacterium]
MTGQATAEQQGRASAGDATTAGDGVTVWFTGLPSAGKTTLARALTARLRAAGHRVEMLDGDELRTYLTADLGFSRQDRSANVLRVGYVAHLLSRNGVIVVCSLISPFRDDRDQVRALHGDRFMEVYLSTPVEVCAERDVKGLYARQRAGDLTGLTGVDDPYEPPLDPELVVPTHAQDLDASIDMVWAALPPAVTGVTAVTAVTAVTGSTGVTEGMVGR